MFNEITKTIHSNLTCDEKLDKVSKLISKSINLDVKIFEIPYNDKDFIALCIETKHEVNDLTIYVSKNNDIQYCCGVNDETEISKSDFINHLNRDFEIYDF